MADLAFDQNKANTLSAWELARLMAPSLSDFARFVLPALRGGWYVRESVDEPFERRFSDHYVLRLVQNHPCRSYAGDCSTRSIIAELEGYLIGDKPAGAVD